ncbi:uncharacterized protein LOC114474870 [Gouania willdenowi]|uniref:uncharacterized protein LOC114474870 n=1 Tax=Gouania willdenowi TaxID=441366 RepID=UPI001056E063|nr:uncharacterized protein LOC114474870 [Gouania willdenowi]XP_028321246.1 uncharacterized protein LOC114474870 [Gouania willdenowi]
MSEEMEVNSVRLNCNEVVTRNTISEERNIILRQQQDIDGFRRDNEILKKDVMEMKQLLQNFVQIKEQLAQMINWMKQSSIFTEVPQLQTMGEHSMFIQKTFPIAPSDHQRIPILPGLPPAEDAGKSRYAELFPSRRPGVVKTKQKNWMIWKRTTKQRFKSGDLYKFKTKSKLSKLFKKPTTKIFEDEQEISAQELEDLWTKIQLRQNQMTEYVEGLNPTPQIFYHDPDYTQKLVQELKAQKKNLDKRQMKLFKQKKKSIQLVIKEDSQERSEHQSNTEAGENHRTAGPQFGEEAGGRQHAAASAPEGADVQESKQLIEQFDQLMLHDVEVFSEDSRSTNPFYTAGSENQWITERGEPQLVEEVGGPQLTEASAPGRADVQEFMEQEQMQQVQEQLSQHSEQVKHQQDIMQDYKQHTVMLEQAIIKMVQPSVYTEHPQFQTNGEHSRSIAETFQTAHAEHQRNAIGGESQYAAAFSPREADVRERQLQQLMIGKTESLVPTELHEIPAITIQMPIQITQSEHQINTDVGRPQLAAEAGGPLNAAASAQGVVNYRAGNQDLQKLREKIKRIQIEKQELMGQLWYKAANFR